MPCPPANTGLYDIDALATASANLEKATSLAGGGEVWLAILRVLAGLVHMRILSQRPIILPSNFWPEMSPDLAAMLYNAHQLEYFASTFTHFVISCAFNKHDACMI